MNTYYVQDSITKEYSISGTKDDCNAFVNRHKHIYPNLVVLPSTAQKSIDIIHQRSKGKTLIQLIQGN
jgi:hypothetical protein